MLKILLLIFVVASISCTQKEKKACCAPAPEEVSQEHKGHEGHEGHHGHHGQSTEPVLPSYKEDSLYNVKTMWEDNKSNKVSLSSFKNVPVLITMTYTSCQYSCPMTLKKLEEIEKRIKAKGYNNYKIAVVSFDTVRDTPKRFTEYMSEKKLDSKRYVFMRSQDKSKVREIAIHLGINYKEEAGNEYSHSNMITLLDKNGVIAQQINGIGGDPTDLINKLIQMK